MENKGKSFNYYRAIVWIKTSISIGYKLIQKLDDFVTY
jgi:transposase